MSSILDVSASSDSEDDADYVPSGDVVPSESDEEDDFESEEKPKQAKTKKTVYKKEDPKEPKSENTSTVSETDPKKHADEIWKSFLSDVESSPTTNKSSSNVSDDFVKSINYNAINSEKSVCKPEEACTENVFEFAGETFTVALGPSNSSPKTDSAATVTPFETKQDTVFPKKRSGLDSVLGTILNKKQKMTTLQKSQYDWKTFKKTEGIEEDLEKFNKGRGGFIERQKFLQRSDMRSFEVEKSVRQSKKKKIVIP